MEVINLNKYFYCYSWKLKEYLRNNGVESIVSGIHPTTNKKYWVFDKNNEKLDKLLTAWKLNKR